MAALPAGAKLSGVTLLPCRWELGWDGTAESLIYLIVWKIFRNTCELQKFNWVLRGTLEQSPPPSPGLLLPQLQLAASGQSTAALWTRS